MSKFYSSRNTNDILNENMAIINGLSIDSGLDTPKIDDIKKYNLKELYESLKINEINSNVDYKDLSFNILSSLFDTFDKNALKASIDKSYSLFDNIDVCNTSKIGDDYLLELYHGKTSAFKDVALSLLPYLLNISVKNENINKLIYILCATSGDTGKAALEGFKNVPNTYITVFYPKGAVSKIQELQMVTQEGNNTNVVSVNANFDECQRIVKNIMSDRKNILENKNILFSSANSINIGRLFPQIVYYFKSYFDLVKNNIIKLNDLVNFAVPTGNFGDILAGYFAKTMGLPINKLILATNKNSVLYDFIETGIYDINRPFYETISPSMDILISSNLERLLFIESNYDSELIKKYMEDLKENKKYAISKDLHKKIKDTFISFEANEKNIMNTINDTFKNKNRLIDTHTACSTYAPNKYNELYKGNNVKTIILSTASPYKSSKSVLYSIINTTYDDEFKCMDELFNISKEPIPKNLSNLKNKNILHTDTIEPSLGTNYIKKTINNILKQKERNR